MSKFRDDGGKKHPVRNRNDFLVDPGPTTRNNRPDLTLQRGKTSVHSGLPKATKVQGIQRGPNQTRKVNLDSTQEEENQDVSHKESSLPENSEDKILSIDVPLAPSEEPASLLEESDLDSTLTCDQEFGKNLCSAIPSSQCDFNLDLSSPSLTFNKSHNSNVTKTGHKNSSNLYEGKHPVTKHANSEMTKETQEETEKSSKKGK